LGPLIHNPQVLARLEEKGVRIVESPDEVSSGTVVIRSHGVSREVIELCERRGLTIADATCAYVVRLHRLAAEASARMPVCIVGQADHPEVRGTAGWCAGDVYIVDSIESAGRVPLLDEAAAVAQTTLPPLQYKAITDALAERVKRLVVYDTVCLATSRRQREATELADWADVMIVVGGRDSANTRKLYETCKERCPRSLRIEGPEELPEGLDPARDNIGITAGASTPDWVLKEVVNRMNDIEQNAPVPQLAPTESQENENASFMKDIEATLIPIRTGQTITGTVVQVTEDEICVNIGYKSDGLVKRSDLVSKDVHVGDEIDVEVVKVNDGEGNVLLSQRNVVSRKNWDALMTRYDEGGYVEGVGREAVKGGLIANVMGVRAFIPASQLSQRYVEKIEDFVGKTMRLKIIEADKSKKRIVCSRKIVIAEEAVAKKKEAWDKLAVGEVVPGVVRRLTDFGAFVDVGGVDGLVHVTDLSWGRVKHPSEIVQPNQEIQVKVLSLDQERDRIQLGYKQTQPRPWEIAEEKYPPGSIVSGKVVRITTFGAFVELEPGLDGLVHISQCALSRIAKVEDAVEVGQIVRVKVLSVDSEAKRISLSIRAVLEDEAFMYSDDIPGESLGDETAYTLSDDSSDSTSDAPY
jgi:4-hydroxy-3-methylbut-2-enyl diphosphate reductase